MGKKYTPPKPDVVPSSQAPTTWKDVGEVIAKRFAQLEARIAALETTLAGWRAIPDYESRIAALKEEVRKLKQWQ